MEEHPDYNLFHVAFVIVCAELVRGLKDNYLAVLSVSQLCTRWYRKCGMFHISDPGINYVSFSVFSPLIPITLFPSSINFIPLHSPSSFLSSSFTHLAAIFFISFIFSCAFFGNLPPLQSVFSPGLSLDVLSEVCGGSSPLSSSPLTRPTWLPSSLWSGWFPP